MTPRGRVFIIGAGPGDPRLVTARGVQLLAEADVVVYDRAAEPALRWARPDAERILAGAPAERETAQDALSMLVAEKARDGHVVARLKWGDPYVFDSGAKEALFLHEQQVPFEIVPGVPAAVGTAAYSGIPLTYPEAGDTLVLIRGSEDGLGRLPDVDWPALAELQGTWACLAAGSLVPAMLQALVDHGAPADGGAALVFHGTQPAQQTVAGTIGGLLAATSVEPPPGAALLVVGEVTRLREYLRWYDERPLFGRRIVITRSQEQARELVDMLESLGAQVVQAPTFRLAPPEDPEAIDRALSSVDDYRWLIFQSANAVARFMTALARGPRDVRALGRAAVCAVGASTAERLLAAGIKPDVTLPESGGESIADAIGTNGSLSATRVLIVRPDHLRSTLGEDLSARGAAVTDLVAYRTEPAPADSPAAQALYAMLLDGTVDAVTFTNPTAVQRFASLIGHEQAADLLNTTTVVTIGPVTARAAIELGVRQPLVADTYTVEGLVRKLVDALTRAT
ncbi:MAG: uroporphyrinogen-III synthase [Acidobacteria bacterium]|nr:uroporphyrinogen-III synthase [Acidobacteriota bacterium]